MKNPPHYKIIKQNIDRMKKGLAPQRFNPIKRQIESIELHHNPLQRNGGLFEFMEVWPEEHVEIDSLRNIGK